MPTFICAACGTRYPASPRPPERCRICADVRQYVPEQGQRWLDPVELASQHRNRIVRHEHDLYGIGSEPSFAIGQRALLVRTPDGNLLWDCITLLDGPTVEAVQALGGVDAIAISHPHYYSAMRAWGAAFDAPVHLHEADREWVVDQGPELRFWSGERKALFGGLELIRSGGHFPGGTVAHWPAGAEGRGALLSGDILMVVPDRSIVSFMYSYPNLLPLPGEEVRRVAASVDDLAFDRIYGAWWERRILSGAKEAVRRGRDRYLAALAGRLQGLSEATPG